MFHIRLFDMLFISCKENENVFNFGKQRQHFILFSVVVDVNWLERLVFQYSTGVSRDPKVTPSLVTNVQFASLLK